MPEHPTRSYLTRLGAGADDLRLPVKQALAAVARTGLHHVELTAAGELSPTELTRTGRRHLARYLRGLGLRLAALGGTTGGRPLEEQASLASRTLEMAAELGVEVVTVSLADLGHRQGQDPGDELREVLGHLAERADLAGRTLAIETAAVEPARLRQLVADVNCEQVKACVDPGELICSGHDPKESLCVLADWVGLARARDGLAGRADHPGREVQLGTGQVDLRDYLVLLREFGYRRPLLIRRRDSDRPLADLLAAKKHLEDLARSMEAE